MKRRNVLRAVGGAMALPFLAQPGAAEFCNVVCEDRTEEDCERVEKYCREEGCGGCTHA